MIRTKPLSSHALAALVQIRRSASGIMRQEFNSGVAQRLERDGLVDTTTGPSLYPPRTKADVGRQVQYLLITDAGRAILAETERPAK